MPFSRRKALALIGGGTIFAAGAAGGAFVSTRTPKIALAPWDQAGGYDDPRLRALSFALLAPSPHNLQPWLAELRGEDQIVIWQDPDRTLPHTDPNGRQLTIGMGCFLELMDLAAGQEGHGVDTVLFPEGADGPVAIATLVSDQAEPDPLFQHVMERRSCKEPFAADPVPAAAVDALTPLATVITAPEDVEALRSLTWKAWQIEVATPRTHKESVDLMRFGKREINANPDGIDLGGPLLEGLMLAGLLNSEKQLDPQSTSYKQGVAIYEEMLNATPAYVALVSEGNGAGAHIKAGRDWLRLNLTTTSLGLALHPVSQALQEYPEMEAPYRELHAMLAEPGQTVQMLGRLGRGPKTPRTPRWPLDARMRNA
ncbi:MAG: twin-arginine translocation pathway signal protein [Pseudomonadota bacterium]